MSGLAADLAEKAPIPGTALMVVWAAVEVGFAFDTAGSQFLGIKKSLTLALAHQAY